MEALLFWKHYQCCKNLVKIWQRWKFFLHFCCLHGHERIRSANMEEAVFLVCLTNYGHVCMDLEVLHGEWRYPEHAYITIAMKKKFWSFGLELISWVLPLQSIFLFWKPLKSTQHPWIWVVRHKNRPNRSSSSKVMVNFSQDCDIEKYISLTRDPHPHDPRVSGQEKNLDPRVMTRGSPLLN